MTEATVLAWLRRAAEQAEAINHHLLRHLPVTQVQLDEMWSFRARKHARETDEAGESVPGGEEGRQWVWVSFAPEFRLMSAAVVGPRTLDTAKEVVAATKARVAGIPAFFSDGFTWYLAALLAAFHVVMTCAPTGKRGRIYRFGDRVKPNKVSKRPLTQASLRCKRWLNPSSLQRMPTPLKRCWMSHLQALSTMPLPSGHPSSL